MDQHFKKVVTGLVVNMPNYKTLGLGLMPACVATMQPIQLFILHFRVADKWVSEETWEGKPW